MAVTITIDVPPEIVAEIQAHSADIVSLLESGLRAFQRRELEICGLHCLREIADFLATLPTPQQVLAFRPSPELENRVLDLVAKKRADVPMTAQGHLKLRQYELMEHFVRMAKSNAAQKLAASENGNDSSTEQT